MSNYNDIRHNLADAIKSFNPTMNVYAYMPRTYTPPVAIVKPSPSMTINYEQAQSASTLADWHFSVMIVIGQIDEEAAQTQAGDLVSPGSPLIRALQNCMRFVRVTGANVSEMPVPGGPGGASVYTHVELSVIVTA